MQGIYNSVAASIFWLFLTVLSSQAYAETKVFRLGGRDVTLNEVSATAEVYYQAMRFNALSNQWHFDLILRNTAIQPLQGPVVAVVSSMANTAGPVTSDGTDQDGKAWFNLSSLIPGDGLLTGKQSAARTISLLKAIGTAS
ncbi:MAG: hypothetical protein ACO1QB_14400, partial [Verrucomicrobiales bacterium]